MRRAWIFRQPCIGIACFCLLGMARAQAQNIQAELAAIQEAYQCNQRFSLQMEFTLFAAHDASSILEQENGQIYQAGASRKEQYFGYEVLYNPGQRLIINHEAQTVLVQPAIEANSEPLSHSYFQEIAPLVAQCEEALLIPQGNQRLMRFRCSKSSYEQVTISYIAQSRMIQEINLYFRNPLSPDEGGTGGKPRIRIRYTDIRLDPEFAGDFFAAQAVLKKRAGGYQLTEAYRNYTLLNEAEPAK